MSEQKTERWKVPVWWYELHGTELFIDVPADLSEKEKRARVEAMAMEKLKERDWISEEVNSLCDIGDSGIDADGVELLVV